MYCPKCGIQTTDSAAFCRGCGSNLSLVSQALTGSLVPASTDLPWVYTGGNQPEQGHKGKKPPNLGEGITSIVSGIGFVLVALATLFYAPAGRIWWYWMLIPAFTFLGKGIATLVELKMSHPAAVPQIAARPPAPKAAQLPQAEPYAVAPPPSVIEATTRHLDRSRE
jgi:hypothetical protein